MQPKDEIKSNRLAIIFTYAKKRKSRIQLFFLFFLQMKKKKQGSLCEQPVFAFELPEKKIITSNDDINFSFQSKTYLNLTESAINI